MEIINANPTKEFFIDMLTRDIKLERAIIDLIDNSIDGARNTKLEEGFNEYKVTLTINQNYFEIQDNCGGIALDIALNQAFRFGRPSDAQTVNHSIGRFGVGMKRALFKIGNNFTIESKHGEDHFLIEVNVKQWVKEESWEFEYTPVNRGDKPGKLTEDGTYIKIDNLHSNIASEFNLTHFINQLNADITRTLSYIINQGLTIIVNNTTLQSEEVEILKSEKIQPIAKSLKLAGDQVTVQIFAGIGEASPEKAGWYIYCNDRLILEKDKTNLTGWEGRIYDESDTVKFHHIYAMFRGIVSFQADDSTLLPITTTKTGIDANSNIYKRVKEEMISMMKQVISFLKKLKTDEDREEIKTDTEKVNVNNLKVEDFKETFRYPEIQSAKASSRFANISYKKEKDKIDTVKKALNISSNREVGEETFDYFYKMEVE
ncbi:ATP-binding protein [Microscilla marina]|uniref:ATP-binding protein n=1 Tax=Microscilla marina ATCC 23134 TaxID=313606 RepID=A1ZY58_MICM2|nr:ATP-binding protein [Microscilla marina]EAY24710.1 conserved hypothetical protein [Microscilla marina ATCC 23134]